MSRPEAGSAVSYHKGVRSLPPWGVGTHLLNSLPSAFGRPKSHPLGEEARLGASRSSPSAAAIGWRCRR